MLRTCRERWWWRRRPRRVRARRCFSVCATPLRLMRICDLCVFVCGRARMTKHNPECALAATYTNQNAPPRAWRYAFPCGLPLRLTAFPNAAAASEERRLGAALRAGAAAKAAEDEAAAARRRARATAGAVALAEQVGAIRTAAEAAIARDRAADAAAARAAAAEAAQERADAAARVVAAKQVAAAVRDVRRAPWQWGCVMAHFNLPCGPPRETCVPACVTCPRRQRRRTRPR